MVRELVVTADDLGRDPATDDTVLALLTDGHVTATTLLVVATRAHELAAAVVAAGVVPRLHLALTSERELEPWRPRGTGAGLVDDGGALPVDPARLGGASTAAVLAELDAQLAAIRSWGVEPGAADSHAGTLYGLDGRPWLAPTLRWCAAHGLGFRLPRLIAPYVGGVVPDDVARAHRSAVALADELGVPLPQAMVTNRLGAAELGGYDVLRDHLVAALHTLPEGTSELFLHPAEGLAGEVGVVRSWEAQLLRDPRWHEALAAASIELVSGDASST